jgi:hypothetical protein
MKTNKILILSFPIGKVIDLIVLKTYEKKIKKCKPRYQKMYLTRSFIKTFKDYQIVETTKHLNFLFLFLFFL